MENENNNWTHYAAAAMTGLLNRTPTLPLLGGGDTVEGFLPHFAQLAARAADLMVAEQKKRST